MAKSPILPRNPHDPTGIDKLERGAINDFTARLRKIRKKYIEAIDRFPSKLVVNARYLFDIDPGVLETTLDDLNAFIDSLLLQGGPTRSWFFEAYVSTAYQRGTAQTHANLAYQSPAYASGRRDLGSLIRSAPYQRRLGILNARVFEDMRGLAGDVKRDMNRVLTSGMARGMNPRDIAKDLTRQTGIEEGRARRIARTEVPMALRRARWDERDEAAEDFGVNTKLMQISALSPTTRATHAARHGKLFTSEQMRDWYSVDGNAINCFLPGTRVQGRFVAGSKARYRGAVVKVVLRSGLNLTVTPNHPVMSSAGLVPAAEVRKGDHLIRDARQVELRPRPAHLDREVIGRPIEHVFGSILKPGHSARRRVTEVDFHGDARFMEEEVEVVWAERELVVGGDAASFKFLNEVALVSAEFPAPAECALDLARFRVGISASSVERAGGNFLTRLKAQIGVAIEGRGTTASELNASRTEALPEHLAVDAGFDGDGLDGAPCVVALDEVVEVMAFDYHGFVFDLEERSGLMVANGILTSNCKCSSTEVMVDENGKPLVPAIEARARQNYAIAKKRSNAAWAKE